MHRILVVLVVFGAGSSVLAAPKVPAGVRYVTASAAVNAKAKASLEQMFAQSPPKLEGGAHGLLMLGPFLGLRLGGLDMSPFLPVNAVIPFGDTTAHMKSFGARTPEEARALLGLVRDFAPGPSPTIRPMSPAEMRLVWPFISWDLAEPLFVVESKERKWVVNFAPDGSELRWIEDLTEPCFTTTEGGGACTCLRVEPKGTDWQLGLTRKKSCANARAEATPPAPQDLRLTRLLQPDDVLSKRVTADSLAAYIKRVGPALAAVASQTTQKPTALVVSVAVKESGERRLWLTASTKTPLPKATLDRLREALVQVEPPTTRGLVVFELHYQLWGGSPLPAETFESFPDEWRAVTTKHAEPVDVESLVLEAWN